MDNTYCVNENKLEVLRTKTFTLVKLEDLVYSPGTALLDEYKYNTKSY